MEMCPQGQLTIILDICHSYQFHAYVKDTNYRHTVVTSHGYDKAQWDCAFMTDCFRLEGKKMVYETDDPWFNP